MQAILPKQPSDSSPLGRKIGYFMLPPLLALVLLTILLALLLGQYRAEHDGRVLTGVTLGGIDLSGKTAAEAEVLLASNLPFLQQSDVRFIDPGSDREWVKSPEDLGMSFDGQRTVQSAMDIGRTGGPLAQARDTFDAWYYGRSIAPVIIFDEGQLNRALDELADEVYQPAVDAAIAYEDNAAQFHPGQPGRELDTAELRSRLIAPVSDFRAAEVELLVHETFPTLYNDSDVALEIQQILSSPLTLYLTEPLDEFDLEPVELPPELLASWLRVDAPETSDSTLEQNVRVDENAVRHWLRQYENQLYRNPVNARFYFDDDTRELVLVAPHINGRALDLDATVAQLLSQVSSSNRSVPLIMQVIEPTVHSGATASDLGITELITATTTWFYGSSDARKHNIARSAANFFGIVVAPGEEFSFNNYLGSVSEDDGYEEGFIIVGGRTINGIGGGVCQVSTTLYQSAFLAGFPITERWEHGYMVGYYNDGEGPGMDATVFSPIVDMKFINNTPYHLLIENYYNEVNEALTFKMYSTGMGREVVKTEPVFENVIPAPEDDVWEYDPDLPEGTVEQIDSAVEGADVIIQRTVLNAEGEAILDEFVTSHYIPYPNVYRYGPGVTPYDYSLLDS
ncbi:MAG: VanW family protein [Candidatus Promineifilaceae bacterium]|nr:VanW family protein [Candidatus Promineifilaceae bacterium]